MIVSNIIIIIQFKRFLQDEFGRPNKKNIKIVYAGYYHSYNLKYILHKYFDYKIILAA